MSRSEQKAVIEKTHALASRREMHAFVERLGRGDTF